MIPGFPYPMLVEMRLERGESPAQALHRELRTRRWIWSSLDPQGMPAGWESVHREWNSHLELWARSDIAPLIRSWCWICTRGRYLPWRIAYRMGSLDVAEGEYINFGRWRWPFTTCLKRDYAERVALARGRHEGREEGFARGKSEGLDQGFHEGFSRGWNAAFNDMALAESDPDQPFAEA